MKERLSFSRSIKDFLVAVGPLGLTIILVFGVGWKYLNPPAPKRIVLSSGEADGDDQAYAKLYGELLKEQGVELVVRNSKGPVENLRRLADPDSEVDVAFAFDGLDSIDDSWEISSLGSVYYQPIWIFYRAGQSVGRLSQLIGKTIAVGREGGGTHHLAMRLLKSSGVNEKNSRLITQGWQEASDGLHKGELDAAVFVATPSDRVIQGLIGDPQIRLMSLDHAEAIARKNPFLHHLVLPRGAIDLKRDLPEKEVHLIASTATLLVRDRLHPTLKYLLLSTASQVHGEPGIFEKKNEFPIDKDFEFPLSDEAKHFYKSGVPFWMRYLPFWMAALIDRFMLLVIPVVVLIYPMIRLVPKIYTWRVRRRIYQCYGELKFLETQIQRKLTPEFYTKYLEDLDGIEDRVHHLKIPLEFSDHVYVLREHIDLVRRRLSRLQAGMQEG